MALRFVRPQAGDLMATLVATLPFAVLAHKEYRRKHRSKNPEKLDWIGLNQHFSRTPEFAWYQKNLSSPARIVCNDFDFVIEAVNRHLGVALLPRAIMSIYPDLVEIPLDLAMPSPLRLWLVMHRHLRHVPKFRVMWEALKAQAICLSEG